ncbi:MAG: PepSY-associated TM helix domain-containing protein [Paludibacter sp.]
MPLPAWCGDLNGLQIRYYKTAGGQKSLAYSEVFSGKQPADSTRIVTEPLDRVWLLMQREYPYAASIEVHPAHSDSASIAANANQSVGKYWKTDYRYFDQYTLREIKAKNIYGRFGDARFADKLFRMNYEIHTGAILGLPGKIFAFLMSLCIASFPVTGFILWWKKRRKKPKKE